MIDPLPSNLITGRKAKLPPEASLPTPKARVETNDRGMNKTEAAYAEELNVRLLAGEIAWYRFEAVKLRLAKKTFYTPDFMVILADGEVQFHEVKGFWRDDARVKIKVAAEQFPFTFVAVQKAKGGGWKTEYFGRRLNRP